MPIAERIFRKRPLVVHITTVPLTLRFFRGQVGHLLASGFDVTVVSSPGPLLDRFGAEEGVRVHGVPMARRIAPLADLVALDRLLFRLRAARPQIVHSHTPKGGLLGMLAATLSGTPVRVYHMRGLPFMTATGARRQLLRATERIACALAHRVYVVSPSLREVALAERLGSREKLIVLGAGSSNGVDARGQFDPEHVGPTARAESRRALGIPEEAVVIGFVGRLVRDKGVEELASAWSRLREAHADAHLLLIGPEEARDAVRAEILSALRDDPRAHLAGFVDDTGPGYAAMDVVALPTYREGFPNVPLEAAAMGLPVVATRIPGCIDAVVEGVTGTLVPPGDAGALETALDGYLRDGSRRAAHGAAGRERVLREFDQRVIWEGLVAGYRELLRERGVVDAGGVLRAPTPRRWRERAESALKRALDVTLAGAALAAAAPVVLGVSLAVRRRLGSPVLFRQQRPGLHGRPFTLVKFRTMTDARDHAGALLSDSVRLTRFGRFLRRTSLDELPTLWNVLTGDMSLVGPRPLLMRYLDRYSPEQARRHEVKPGVTGWTQINGRNGLSWDDKFAHDVWYVDHQSMALDLRILARTLSAVLRREGISHEGEATMPEFLGNAPTAEGRSG